MPCVPHFNHTPPHPNSMLPEHNCRRTHSVCTEGHVSFGGLVWIPAHTPLSLSCGVFSSRLWPPTAWHVPLDLGDTGTGTSYVRNKNAAVSSFLHARRRHQVEGQDSCLSVSPETYMSFLPIHAVNASHKEHILCL